MHVRFVSAVLCGGVSSFPEGFEAAAEDAAAQGEDGVGAVDGPVHAGALEARPDGMFAASLDDAGGDAQAPGPERGIAARGRSLFAEFRCSGSLAMSD